MTTYAWRMRSLWADTIDTHSLLIHLIKHSSTSWITIAARRFRRLVLQTVNSLPGFQKVFSMAYLFWCKTWRKSIPLWTACWTRKFRRWAVDSSCKSVTKKLLAMVSWLCSCWRGIRMQYSHLTCALASHLSTLQSLLQVYRASVSIFSSRVREKK